MSDVTATGGEDVAGATGVSIEDELGEVLDGLRAQRKPETFYLPGWGEKLQVKYRVLEQEEGEEIGERIAEQIAAGDVKNAPLTVLIDGLIKSCLGFYTERDGETVPLGSTLREPTDDAIGWDRRLVEIFPAEKWEELFGDSDITKITARQIVRGILKNDDRLVHQHGTEVNRWSERELLAVHKDF